jgi:CrcB protein
LLPFRGGIAGTLLRFATGTWVNANWPKHFYTATLAVNIVGCLLIGVLYGLFLLRGGADRGARRLDGRLSRRPDDLFILFTGYRAPAGKRASAAGLGLCGISVFGGLLATWACLS